MNTNLGVIVKVVFIAVLSIHSQLALGKVHVQSDEGFQSKSEALQRERNAA